MTDAAIGAGEAKAARAAKEAVDFAKTIGFALLIMLVVRVVVFQPYTIVSSSMEPGLVTGDYVVVSKWRYGWSRASFPFDPPLFRVRPQIRPRNSGGSKGNDARLQP